MICLKCSGDINNCTGCSSESVINVDDNGVSTCLAVCPSPKVNNRGLCASCSTDCLTCSISFDNCTSCSRTSSLPYLYDFSCLDDCPELYYNDLANAACKLCSSITPSINCQNCTSTSTCGTCDPTFIFFENRCLDYVPPGYYDDNGYA